MWSALVIAIMQQAAALEAPEGMVWIPSSEFMMGSDADYARADERPAHRVRVDGFWMDVTEVTNAQFLKFVEATQYKTVAERAVDWESLRKQCPPGTPKPPDELLQPGSLVFTPPSQAVRLDNPGQWWQWVNGANWRHPEGPASDLVGKLQHPVVHVAYEDVLAYCVWSHKRLPTEAEWECAARGGLSQKQFVWGDEALDAKRANVWQGEFPHANSQEDGYPRTSPVKSYGANAFGLFDMAGNVWEWTSDLYRADTYAQQVASTDASKVVINPIGPSKSVDPRNPEAPESRVHRGGSYLCHASYCSSYRPSARMSCTPDTGLEHLGFRCVQDAPVPVKAP